MAYKEHFPDHTTGEHDTVQYPELAKLERTVEIAIANLKTSYQEKIAELEAREPASQKLEKQGLLLDEVKIPRQEEINKMPASEVSATLNKLEEMQEELETAITALRLRESTLTRPEPSTKKIEQRDADTPEEKRFRGLVNWVQTNLEQLTGRYKREQPLLSDIPKNLMATSREVKDGMMAIETAGCPKSLVIVRPGKYIDLFWFDGGPTNERVEAMIKPAILKFDLYNKDNVEVIERGTVRREER